MSLALKGVLEDLLRTRRLVAATPPLRGEERRHLPLPTGIAALDQALLGGFPRGQLSEVTGPASSGRTGVAVALAAGTTRAGALVAWVDAADGFDPASASDAGLDLGRLFWLRGEPDRPNGLARAVSAANTLVGAGLFDLVVLDLVGVPAALRDRLPGPTWLRLQRALEAQPTALVLLAPAHVACGSRGVALSLGAASPRFAGAPGPGRLLRGLAVRAQAGRFTPRSAAFELQAFA